MTDLTRRIPTDINELIDMFGLTQPGVGINGALLRRLREQEGQERSLALWREACSIAQKRLDALVVADESDGRPTHIRRWGRSH